MEVLGWGEIAKGLVRPCVIEAMGEGVDTELEGLRREGEATVLRVDLQQPVDGLGFKTSLLVHALRRATGRSGQSDLRASYDGNWVTTAV
jgi:hypothetical protein